MQCHCRRRRRGRVGADGDPAGDGPSDLAVIATAGLTGRDTTVALRLPPTAHVRVPASITAVVAVCVAFTIFAGVSTPVLSLANSISLPWHV